MTARGTLPRLIGMVHLRPLPGAPGYADDFSATIDAARSDAATLADAGFDGVMIENFGDAPFFADDVPNITVAAMTRAVSAVSDSVSIPCGVNVLRNDGLAAIAVAAATGASFIRVNVLSGVMYSDQGMIQGRAAEIARLRRELGTDVAILADVFVKHAVPPPGVEIAHAAVDLAGRGGADALIVTGTGTGRAADLSALAAVTKAVPDHPVYVGSGVTVGNVAGLLDSASGVIVGSSLKRDGVMSPIDANLAADLVAAAG